MVTVPPPAADAGATAAPSGQIFNGTAANFMGDKFIVSTEDGTIAGWQSGTSAVLRVNNSSTNSIYKGLAIVLSTPQVLVAADFHNGKIDIFDATYHPVALSAGQWTDPSLPSGYAPFNIAVMGNSVYVAYAMQDAEKHDDAAGPGNGALSVFDTTGHLVKSLVATGNALNSPWGIAQVSSGGWGSLPAGALLVGNFGDGAVHAYDPTSGAHLAQLATASGTPLSIDGLWALAFGVSNPDAGISPAATLFHGGNERGSRRPLRISDGHAVTLSRPTPK